MPLSIRGVYSRDDVILCLNKAIYTFLDNQRNQSQKSYQANEEDIRFLLYVSQVVITNEERKFIFGACKARSAMGLSRCKFPSPPKVMAGS
jgi:hypothetical protein